MDTQALVVVALVVAGVLASPSALWAVRGPFMLLGRLEWMLLAPGRALFADGSPLPARLRPGTRWVVMPARVLWFTLYWVLGVPVRFLSALYWDGLLVVSGIWRDAALHVVAPRGGVYEDSRRLWSVVRWVVRFPVRLVAAAIELPIAVLSAVARIVVATAWPTIVAFHGTRFATSGADITQAGRWLVGPGQYVGAGIYFAPDMRVAEHYAGGGSDRAVIVARITPGWVVWPSAMVQRDRQLVGHNGGALARRRPHSFSVYEHRRDNVSAPWWEICYPMPDRTGTHVRTWRIRPVCVVRGPHPVRLWKRLAAWPRTGADWVATVAAIGFLWVWMAWAT